MIVRPSARSESRSRSRRRRNTVSVVARLRAMTSSGERDRRGEDVTHIGLKCVGVPLARTARPRLRGVRGDGQGALRKFSGGVAPAAGGDAAACRRGLRVRAGRRRHRRRRRGAGRRARRRSSTPGSGGCTPRSPSNGRTAAPHAHEDLIVVALGPFDPNARSADRAVRRSRERVRSGYHDDSLRLVGRRLRLLPAIGEPGRTAGAAHRRLPRRARSIDRRDALCTALQLTNFWQDFGRDWRDRPALRAARRHRGVPARGKWISAARSSTTPGRRAMRRVHRPARARNSRPAAPSATA